MRLNPTSLLLSCSIVFSHLCSQSSHAIIMTKDMFDTFSTQPLGDILNQGYWYENTDILYVLNSSVSNLNFQDAINYKYTQQYISGALQNVATEVTQNGPPLLIPINIGNAHWTALVVTRNSSGQLVGIYNNPSGTPMLTDVRTKLTTAVPGLQIIDLQVHQQTDGSSCGAYTAEILSTLANTPNLGALNPNELKALMHHMLQNPRALRNKHYMLVTGQAVPSDFSDDNDTFFESSFIFSKSNTFSYLPMALFSSLNIVDDNHIRAIKVAGNSVNGNADWISSKVDSLFDGNTLHYTIGGKADLSDNFSVAVSYMYNSNDLKILRIDNGVLDVGYTFNAHNIIGYTNIHLNDFGVVFGGAYGSGTFSNTDLVGFNQDYIMLHGIASPYYKFIFDKMIFTEIEGTIGSSKLVLSNVDSDNISNLKLGIGLNFGMDIVADDANITPIIGVKYINNKSDLDDVNKNGFRLQGSVSVKLVEYVDLTFNFERAWNYHTDDISFIVTKVGGAFSVSF